MKKSPKTYDPSSYELAEHFLQDESGSDDQGLYRKRCHDLALAIQDAVEFWFLDPPADPACLKKAEKDPNEGREGYELYEGKWRKVLDGSRSGWWRFNEHYDRDGYCDNPGRGY